MPKPEDSGMSAPGTKIERRRRPRHGVDRMDWETKVLKRMEQRLRSISATQGHDHDGQGGLDWEEAPLTALQGHIRTLR